MPKRTVLVVGASIAGPATAFWLVRAGFQVTVVEAAPRLRQGGNGVDIREQALAVVERMGLLDKVRENAEPVLGVRFVDAHDRETARIDSGALARAIGSEDIEIPRGALSKILFEATEEAVEYRFGETVSGLDQDTDGVLVTFERHPPRRFDFVIGADGLHSRVRRLAFGAESNFAVFKDHYFATCEYRGHLAEQFWTTFYNDPGRAVAIYQRPNSEALVNFIFRSSPIAYDYRDIRQQQQIIVSRFSDMGWNRSDLLAGIEGSTNFYFDSVSQVRLDRWSTERIMLVGDAAYCASPASGAGALLALVGAYRLAGALSLTSDPGAALRGLETAHRPLVDKKQRTLFTGISTPRTRLGILSRNLLIRSPAFGALSGLRAPVPPLENYGGLQ